MSDTPDPGSVQDADKAARDLSGGDQRPSKREEETRQIQRVASLSILINLLLVGIRRFSVVLSCLPGKPGLFHTASTKLKTFCPLP